jgi:hypothetical protein
MAETEDAGPTPADAAPQGVQPGSVATAQAGTAAPVEYADFTLPDGVSVDAATLEEARGLFAGAKLPQESAQKFVDFYAGKMQALAEAPHRAWGAMQEQWVGDINRDGEIGGTRLKATIEAAGKAIDAFGSPGLREALNLTGAGNHPEVVRFFARIGRAISEDGHVAGSAARAARSTAEMMFPTMQQQE